MSAYASTYNILVGPASRPAHDDAAEPSMQGPMGLHPTGQPTSSIIEIVGFCWRTSLHFYNCKSNQVKFGH